MNTFRDKFGKTYNVGITVGTVKRVKELTGFDLMSLVDISEKDNVSVLQNFAKDIVLTVDVLYAVVEPQCKEAGVSDIQFGESLNGDSIEEGTKSLFKALSDFSPAPQRGVLTKILQLQERREEMAKKELEKFMEIPLEELDSMLRKSGMQSISSPESVE